MSAEPQYECTVCDAPDAFLCGRCKSTCYCSSECQQIDWACHKLLCANFAMVSLSTRPTRRHVRAFHFPADEKKPRVYWLECVWHHEDSGRSYQSAKFESKLGSEAIAGHRQIQSNAVLQRELPDTIYVAYRDSFLTDGSTPNKSIASITATKPGQYQDWRGPIIVYGKSGVGNSRAFKDLDMIAFRHITDYFLDDGYKPAPSIPQIVAEKIEAVRINCVGDQKMFGRPHFQAVEISTTDAIFSQHDSSEIAERIGIPIFSKQYTMHSAWADMTFEGKFATHNPDATFLHVGCDPTKNDITIGAGWGYAHMKWQNAVGSVLIVRQDKKPMSPVFAEALCKYCRHECGPMFGHSMGEYGEDDRMSEKKVLGMICRPMFNICLYKLLEEKTRAGELLEPFPFEL